MHPVENDEIVALAGAGVKTLADGSSDDTLNRNDVSWKSIVLADERPPEGRNVFAAPQPAGKSPRTPMDGPGL